MNFENLSALLIRFFGVSQMVQALDDIFFCMAKQATDAHFDSYRYYSVMIGCRIFLGLIAFILAIPLGKKIANGLIVNQKDKNNELDNPAR